MANSGTFRQFLIELQDVLTVVDADLPPVDPAQRMETWMRERTPKWEPCVIQYFMVLWHYMRNNPAVTTEALHEAIKGLADRSVEDAINMAQLYLHECEFLNELTTQPFPHDIDRALYCYKMAFRLALEMDIGTELPTILMGIFKIYRSRFQDVDSFIAAFIQEANDGDMFAGLWVGWFKAPERFRQALLNNPTYQQKTVTLDDVETRRDNLILQVFANYSDFAKTHFQVDLAAKIPPELSYAETIYYFRDVIDLLAAVRPNTTFQVDMHSIRNFFVYRTDPLVIEDGRRIRFWHEPNRWKAQIERAAALRVKHWEVNCPNTDPASVDDRVASRPTALSS